VSELCCPLHGIHTWIMSAVRILSFRALSDQEIFDRIHALTRGSRRHVPDSEITKSIAKVRATDVSIVGGSPAAPKNEFKPEILSRVASNLEEVVDDEYLRLRSKFTLHNRTPAGFLHKLFRPGEKVIVFDVFESQGCEIWTHPGPAGDLSTLNYLRTGCFGVWYLVQPVDGKAYWNPREGKLSRRSEESITSWRYAVVESDHAEPASWLRALVQLPLPIAAIYSTGGRLPHALVRIDAGSKAEWDHIVREWLQPSLVTLGACNGSLSAVRLSRLPNCMRGETGKLQQLLYLDDDPDDTPICRKPRRDPDTLRTAWKPLYDLRSREVQSIRQ
jgi:hypothetical protein